MDFYSLGFFTFALITLVLYYATPGRFRWIILLAASCYFYATFKVACLGILALCTLVAYLAALGMERFYKSFTRKSILIVALVAQLGVLFVFKYFDFLNVSMAEILGAGGISYSPIILNLVVPVGISFYIFQNIGYLTDVYRRNQSAEKHLGHFALYLCFFPKLLSGPIERAGNFLPQLREQIGFDAENVTNGLKLVCWGLFKKMVIADRLAAFVNVVYADPQAYSGVSLTMACVFYSFQIYCDFSGYTDIAIGLGQMFGLKLTDNFNRPYSATSVADFWRRWHISLSSWLRDYLYIPLGGNRVGPWRHYLNYLIVFLICGMWHGASWTFVAWGLLHGLYLIAGRATAGWRAAWTSAMGLHQHPALHRLIKICITFALVTLAWIFFRAETMSDAVYVITHLHTGWTTIFNGDILSSGIFITRSRLDLAIVLACLAFFGVIHKMERHENMRRLFANRPIWLRFVLYYLLAAGILFLSPPDAATSIYFQF